jgi:hypothetical protein
MKEEIMLGKKSLIFFTVVLATIALLGHSKVWAESVNGLPCETVRVFDEQIKVEFNATCENVLHVYFCGHWDNDGLCDQWDPPTNKVTNPYICICNVDSDAPAGTVCNKLDFSANLGVDGLTVKCHRIKNAGALGRGCPFYGTRGYLSAGDYYSR